MLATDPDSKAAKKKKKEEAETAKAKEDVKSRKMDDYDDEDDDEYEYVDEYPRFRPGRIILGIISLLTFGFCIYKGFVTGLSTSGADVTSASAPALELDSLPHSFPRNRYRLRETTHRGLSDNPCAVQTHTEFLL